MALSGGHFLLYHNSMIASIKGNILSKNDSYAVVEIAGIGYKVYLPKGTLEHLSPESSAIFFTHLVVKEDALDLYGFETEPERDFFQLLIGISGIGPKGALGILNIASLETIEHAILSGDSGYLTKVSGIGKKTAEKIVLELKDKLKAHSFTNGNFSPSPAMRGETEAIDALQSLGYSEREIRNVLSEIPKDLEKTDEKILAALKILGKK
ncbi:MAG TPA: Holliday junction branch migration protein RuvA [Candidatus Paceibacterota bacterium]|nr:Holliday junction branch migration protein RuvA [Candidatus Paceibacterota bacterium]